jgi:hypothetical protein
MIAAVSAGLIPRFATLRGMYNLGSYLKARSSLLHSLASCLPKYT